MLPSASMCRWGGRSGPVQPLRGRVRGRRREAAKRYMWIMGFGLSNSLEDVAFGLNRSIEDVCDGKAVLSTCCDTSNSVSIAKSCDCTTSVCNFF
jgi:hypothetical protein